MRHTVPTYMVAPWRSEALRIKIKLYYIQLHRNPFTDIDKTVLVIEGSILL